MPNEVLANICTYATDGDDPRSQWREGKSWLKAVRLTCTRLNPPATSVLGRRFFKRLRVMAARGSLKTLLEICSHPLIGPHVSKIELCGRRLDQELLSPLRRTLEFQLRRKQLRGIRLARSRLQSFMNFLEEEVELDQREGIFHLLVEALRVIRTYGHSVDLAVFTTLNEDQDIRTILDWQEATDQLSEDSETPLNNIITHDGVRSSCRTLLAAAIRSGCRVDEFSLEASDSWFVMTHSQYDKDNTLPYRAQDLFLHVKAFRMYVDADLYVGDLDGWVTAVLPLAKNLEVLHLHPRSYSYESSIEWNEVDAFGKTIQSLQSDCLREIEVEEAVCRQGDLVSLLDRHKHTLRHVSLGEFGLVGSWEQILTWIRDHCSLTYLGMSALYESDKDATTFSWAGLEKIPSDVSRLDDYLEQRRKKQAEEEED